MIDYDPDRDRMAPLVYAFLIFAGVVIGGFVLWFVG